MLCTFYICNNLKLEKKIFGHENQFYKSDYDMDIGNFYDNNLLQTIFYKVKYYFIGVSNKICEGILSEFMFNNWTGQWIVK